MSRHNEDSKIRELRGIQGNAVEIMSVDSCSLYEFRITAVSKYGESKPIYLVQYTGKLAQVWVAWTRGKVVGIYRAAVESSAHPGHETQREHHRVDVGAAVQTDTWCKGEFGGVLVIASSAVWT